MQKLWVEKNIIFGRTNVTVKYKHYFDFNFQF